MSYDAWKLMSAYDEFDEDEAERKYRERAEDEAEMRWEEERLDGTIA